jgi:uncharacterized protein (TIGR03066 family)
MNILRCFSALAIAVACAFPTIAQEKAPQKPDFAQLIVGLWEVEPKGADPKATKLLLEFAKDGKVKMILKGKGNDITVAGTYKITDDKLETALKGNKDSVTIVSINAKEMVTKDTDGAELHLFRMK